MPSPRIKPEIGTWGGVPQKIYNVEMKSYPEEGFVGAELDQVLNDVVIGPEDQPNIIKDACLDTLNQLGVSDPANRIRLSGIPLRK